MLKTVQHYTFSSCSGSFSIKLMDLIVHFSDITELVLSLVPDIFLACKCYHELLLVAMVVQKMDPLGRKQGS